MKTVFAGCLMVLLVVGLLTGCRPVVVPPADTTPPTVSLVAPADAVAGVAINSKVVATFDEPMDPATITADTFTVNGGTTPVAGTVSLSSDGLVATFASTSNLAVSTIFTATITTGVQDVAGNALESAYGWSFTTGTSTDSAAPTVISIAPANGAIGVGTNLNITATFDGAMDPTTVTTATFTVAGPGTTAVSGTVAIGSAGTVATFNPSSDLAVSTTYTATITTGAKDLAGNAVASNFVWHFTTGSATAHGPAPVILGTAGSYAILAKSGVTTVPTSSVTGDIGVSPIDSVAVTGFSLVLDSSGQFATSSQVVGRIYASDYAPQTPAHLTTAVSNMETAYTDAAGRATPDFVELYAGNIGGQILVPGLYKWSTAVTVPTGVTLSGGPDDVWIFQIAEDLTVSNGVIVTLSGGAQPKNVFWQVGGGSGVTLGTTSHFEGIVLTQTAISLGTGATVSGRLLAQTAVSLVSSTVTQPAP